MQTLVDGAGGVSSGNFKLSQPIQHDNNDQHGNFMFHATSEADAARKPLLRHLSDVEDLAARDKDHHRRKESVTVGHCFGQAKGTDTLGIFAVALQLRQSLSDDAELSARDADKDIWTKTSDFTLNFAPEPGDSRAGWQQ